MNQFSSDLRALEKKVFFIEIGSAPFCSTTNTSTVAGIQKGQDRNYEK